MIIMIIIIIIIIIILMMWAWTIPRVTLVRRIIWIHGVPGPLKSSLSPAVGHAQRCEERTGSSIKGRSHPKLGFYHRWFIKWLNHQWGISWNLREWQTNLAKHQWGTSSQQMMIRDGGMSWIFLARRFSSSIFAKLVCRFSNEPLR